MTNYSIQPCKELSQLNKSLIEAEINFSRTVLFMSEIDLTEIENIRSKITTDRPTYTAFIAKAIAQALKEFPYANRRLYHPLYLPFLWYFQEFKTADVAVAIERDEENQVVAYMEVLPDVQNSSLTDVTRKLREFSTASLQSSQQWRSFYHLGMSFPSWLGTWIVKLPSHFPKMWSRYRGGAAMISSPSKYGVDGIVGSWTHPLGFSFGLAQKKAMVKNDEVVAVRAFTFAMNWDRRVMAGAQAARFFARICDLLRHPENALGPANDASAERALGASTGV